MADDRGASRPGDDGKPPDAKPKKRVRTRHPTLIGMAVNDAGLPATPPAAAPIPPPALPAPGGQAGAKRFPAPPRPLGETRSPRPAAPRAPQPPRRGLGAPPAETVAQREKAAAPPPGRAPGRAPAGADRAASDAGAASPPARPPTETSTAPSIDMPLGPSSDDELAAEPTQITGPDEDEAFLAGGEAITGESTQVTPGADAAFDSVPPRVELTPSPEADAAPDRVPPRVELETPFAATPAHPPAVPGGATSASDEGEFAMPSTVVLSQQHDATPAPTYSLDVESGQVALSQQSTWVGDEPAPRRRSLGWMVGIGAVALLLAAVGGLLAWLAFGEPESPEPAIAAQAGEPDAPSSLREPAGEPSGAVGERGSIVEPAVDGEVAAEAVAEGEEEDGEIEAEDDGEPEAAPSAGATVPREELEAFELELPRTARRARRMSRSQRRQMANRLKARALRAYRGEEHAEAERLYREALTYNSWDVAAVEGLARATAQQDRYAEALAWAELAVERNPRSAAAYRVLGDVWRQAGHEDEARRAYRRGLRRNPRDRWLRQRLRDLQ